MANRQGKRNRTKVHTLRLKVNMVEINIGARSQTSIYDQTS